MAAMNWTPKAAIKRIKVGRENGRQVEVDYLQVKDRVTWVRLEHLDAHMETSIAHLDERVVVVRALVSLSNGGSATGHGSAAMAAVDAVEKAETAAVGRALGYLGYGTQTAVLLEDGVVDSPAEVAAEGRGDGATGAASEAAPELPEPAEDVIPADPAEAVQWFRARVERMPLLTIAEDQKAAVAKAIAADLRAAGLSDSVRLAMYRALTGKESGMEMDPRALALLAQLTCRAELLREIGMRAPVLITPEAGNGTRAAARARGGR